MELKPSDVESWRDELLGNHEYRHEKDYVNAICDAALRFLATPPNAALEVLRELVDVHNALDPRVESLRTPEETGMLLARNKAAWQAARDVLSSISEAPSSCSSKPDEPMNAAAHADMAWVPREPSIEMLRGGGVSLP